MIDKALNTIAKWVADGHSFECRPEGQRLWFIFDGELVYHLDADALDPDGFSVYDIAETCDLMRDPDFRCPK